MLNRDVKEVHNIFESIILSEDKKLKFLQKNRFNNTLQNSIEKVNELIKIFNIKPIDLETSWLQDIVLAKKKYKIKPTSKNISFLKAKNKTKSNSKSNSKSKSKSKSPKNKISNDNNLTNNIYTNINMTTNMTTDMIDETKLTYNIQTKNNLAYKAKLNKFQTVNLSKVVISEDNTIFNPLKNNVNNVSNIYNVKNKESEFSSMILKPIRLTIKEDTDVDIDVDVTKNTYNARNANNVSDIITMTKLPIVNTTKPSIRQIYTNFAKANYNKHKTINNNQNNNQTNNNRVIQHVL